MIRDWNDAAVIARVRQGALTGLGRAILLVDEEAIRLILQTSKTGKIYRRRGVEHQASAPGEAPASDTGALVRGRTTEVDPSRMAARLSFRTKHALFMEVGTRNIAPRPFARPALMNKREQVQATIQQAVNEALA